MPRAVRFFIFLGLCLACLLTALWLTLGQMAKYDASLGVFPRGTLIAGVPTGGLDGQAAGMRLLEVYTLTPIELRIGDSVIQARPEDLGLQLDLQAMLNAVGESLSGRSYWSGLWDFLWNRPPAPVQASLACSVSVEKLRAYLQEQVAPRYIQLPVPGGPVLGDVQFTQGRPGSVLDLDQAEPAIRDALCQSSGRVIELTTKPSPAPDPDPAWMLPSLTTLTQVSSLDFDGLVEVYYQDLRSGQEVNFAFNQGREVDPGIAFTGASTIKIPVMISAYNKTNLPLPNDLRKQMELMIDLSDNGSTDEVMKRVLDPNIAPVQVTQDMRALGLKNTFLAGLFYPGAPLLDRYETPANQRTDLSTDPDIYNQTTAGDMGRLLAGIQRCAADGTGALVETFKDGITQAKCQEMTALLAKNRKGVLIEAGLPEGAQLAHKYGWVTDAKDGLLHTVSDAAIVYTPGGDFVLTVYLYHPQQINWDAAQRLVARLSTAAYNFYTTK